MNQSEWLEQVIDKALAMDRTQNNKHYEYVSIT